MPEPTVEEQLENATSYALAAREVAAFFLAVSIAEAVAIVILLV